MSYKFASECNEINKTETLNTERNFSQLFISQKQPGYLIVFRIHNLFNSEPTNCLSVFEHFVELRFRKLIKQSLAALDPLIKTFLLLCLHLFITRIEVYCNKHIKKNCLPLHVS